MGRSFCDTFELESFLLSDVKLGGTLEVYAFGPSYGHSDKFTASSSEDTRRHRLYRNRRERAQAFHNPHDEVHGFVFNY